MRVCVCMLKTSADRFESRLYSKQKCRDEWNPYQTLFNFRLRHTNSRMIIIAWENIWGSKVRVKWNSGINMSVDIATHCAAKLSLFASRQV